MPRINLSSSELMDVARGLRLLARQAQADAEKQGGSSTRRIFEESAQRHLALANDLEAASKVDDRR